MNPAKQLIVKSLWHCGLELKWIQPIQRRDLAPHAEEIRMATLEARKQEMDVSVSERHLAVVKGSRVILLSPAHVIYLYDIVMSFDEYFNAVEPSTSGNESIVDYSFARWHDVVGFDHHPVKFPSFAEPVVTANEYLDFAGLGEGSVVLDLGAYSGLTSILFDRQVGAGGRVIAVDADATNIRCIQSNFSLHEKLTGRRIELVEGAMWKDEGGVEFARDGTMGAAVVDVVGKRGQVQRIASFTLSSIARRFALERVDFIKCDIEGAEAFIFDDAAFFAKYRPKIVVEPHMVAGELSTETCSRAISRFGYRCTPVAQSGVAQRGRSVPLLQCVPASA